MTALVILAVLQTLLLAAILYVLATRRKLLRANPLPPRRPEAPTMPPRNILVTRDGKPHCWVRANSREYELAHKTPGLRLHHPDGTVEEGIQ